METLRRLSQSQASKRDSDCIINLDETSDQNLEILENTYLGTNNPISTADDQFDFNNEQHVQEAYECLCFIMPKTKFAEVWNNMVAKFPDSAEFRKYVTEDPCTMYKQVIAWSMRCGLVGALWTAGYTAGAVLDGATPATAAQSKLAWLGAGVGAGAGEMFCVTMIGYFLADQHATIKVNSNGAGILPNLIEGGIWGVSNFAAATLWQHVANEACSAEDLLNVFAPACMLSVGGATATAFAVSLFVLKAFVTLVKSDYFRGLSMQSTIQDNALFGILVCGAADAFFVLTGTQTPFNYLDYSTADQFSTASTGMQILLSASATTLGGLGAFVLRGGLNGALHLYENWGNINQVIRQDCSALSLNSQLRCTIF